VGDERGEAMSDKLYITDIATESREPEGITREIVDRLSPVAAYACFSGGHDSLVSTHWAMANIPGCKVLHCNTGIGVERTRRYVRETCKEYGWPLVEKFQEGVYESWCVEHGFPGPAQHPRMYQRLKERSIRAACKDAKADKPRSSSVLLVSGVHSGESLIRSAYDRPASKVRGQVWVNPFYYATPDDFDDYRDRRSLPLNPVKLAIGMSGECGCGAFAKKGEFKLWESVCPIFAERVESLQKKVEQAGKPWGWEDAPPRWYLDQQRGQSMFPFMPLCQGCNKRDEMSELVAAGFIKSRPAS
jgi:3'-phosphoadenosine 5'-phosphosulfate sulfotransferase (PAPS reductase)/FAD synthetase